MKPAPLLLRVVVCLLGALAFVSGSARADSLDDTINALMQKRKVPGLSVAIIEDGKIVRARGYGVIENGRSPPVTGETLFQAGSVSKPVAAFGALRLVDAGKLVLDADVTTALKTWHLPETDFTKTEKVTLRRLLSHTAGMTVHGFPGYAVDAPKPTLVQILNGEKPANTPAIRVDVVPGSLWRYAGGGYTVMQQMVIDVTGRPFPELMQDSVLKPLSMLASSYEQPLPEARAAKTATGHYPGGKMVPGRWHIYPEMAAAGLWTTASDLARFAIGVQEALAGKAEAGLSPATALLMVTPGKGNYGLGLSASGSGKTQRFSHNGRNEGFDTQLTAYREGGRGAALMINANENSSFMNQVMSAIAKEYHWPDYPPYRTPAPIDDKEPEVTAQVKTIFEQAQAGSFDRALFSEKLAEALAVQIPNGSASQQLRALGSLNSIALVGRRTNGANRIHRHHLVYENDSIIATTTYDGDGKIVGLVFQPE